MYVSSVYVGLWVHRRESH